MIPEDVSSSVAEWKKDGLDEVQVGSMINNCPGYSSAFYCFCFCSSCSASSIIAPQAEFCTEASTS